MTTLNKIKTTATNIYQTILKKKKPTLNFPLR